MDADLRKRIEILSGAGKRGFPGRRRRGIYTSWTLPGLDDIKALRDTDRRFDDFSISTDLSGLTAIDVGSNVGAFAVELARRGAAVTGIEYCVDRVILANEIASASALNAKFYQHDLRIAERGLWDGLYDLVVCCSVDEYIDDVDALYRFLRSLCGGTLYLESNIQRGAAVPDTVARLKDAGFVEVAYVGNGHSGGVSRKRKLFTAKI